MSYGQKSVVGLNFQNSYGTAAASPAHYIPFLSESIVKKIPPLIDGSIRDIHDEGDSYEGPHTVEGDIEINVNAISVGAILRAGMSLIASVQSGGIYKHNFTPRATDFDNKSAQTPITVWVDRDGGRSVKHQDLNVTGLEFNIANGEFLKLKASVVGGDASSHAALTPTYTLAKKFPWNVASVTIGGSAVSDIVDMTITIDDGLEAMHTLNSSKVPSRIKRSSFRTVSVSGTLKFDNHNEYDQFISQSERSASLYFKNTVTIQSGYTESIEMVIPALRYEDLQANATGPGQIEAQFSGKAKYHVGSAVPFRIYVVNTQTTY